MKHSAADAKIGSSMMKGETPFDLAKVKEIFAIFDDAAAKMPNFFRIAPSPASSPEADDRAGPKIWENMADFKARFAKFGDDIKAAQRDDQGPRRLQGGNPRHRQERLRPCHQTYRVKTS